MKKLAALALILAIFVPTLAAQAAANFSGKWEGTFAIQRPDGTEGPARAALKTFFHNKGEFFRQLGRHLRHSTPGRHGRPGSAGRV